jgi:hypothetical protein
VKEDLHDSKRPACFEHRTLFIHVVLVSVARDGNQAEIGAVRPICCPSAAICIADTSKLIYGTDKSADEKQIDERDKFGGMACARV